MPKKQAEGAKAAAKSGGKKGQGGAKGKYKAWLTPEGLEMIRDWARAGLNNEEMAHNMGIRPSTFYDWQKKYIEFSEALLHARAIVDAKVENALFKSATGYYIAEEQAIKVKDEGYDANGKKYSREHVEIVEVRKWIPANALVQMFVISNRRPEEWKKEPTSRPSDIQYISNTNAAEADDHESIEVQDGAEGSGPAGQA